MRDEPAWTRQATVVTSSGRLDTNKCHVVPRGGRHRRPLKETAAARPVWSARSSTVGTPLQLEVFLGLELHCWAR